MNAVLGRATLVLAAVTAERVLLAPIAFLIVLMAYMRAQLVVQSSRPEVGEHSCAPTKQKKVTSIPVARKMYKKGDAVQVRTRDGSWKPATLISVHSLNSIESTYHVKVEGSSLEMRIEESCMRWPVAVSAVPALASPAVFAPATETVTTAAVTTAVSTTAAAAASKGTFQKGNRVQYFTTAKKWVPATVVSVHLVGAIDPEYHVRVDGSSLEKHTEADRLRRLITQHWPQAPALASATATAAASKGTFQKGDRVQYFTTAKKWAPATVVSVHLVGAIDPEYHVRVDGSSLEKHTEAKKLRWPQASTTPATAKRSAVGSATAKALPKLAASAAAEAAAGTYERFQKGDRVHYFTAAKKWVPATVVSVHLHFGGIDPEYHIVADGSSLEKHTEADRLRCATTPR